MNRGMQRRGATALGTCCAALGLALALFCAYAVAQESPGAQLDAAEARLADAQKALNREPDAAALDSLRVDLLEAQGRAEDLSAQQAPRLAAVQARLTELGPAPEGGVHESADVTALRNQLTREAAELDGTIRRARLVALSAQQLTDRIAEQRRALFRARLWERARSPLAPAFWTEAARYAQRDLVRIGALAADIARAAVQALRPPALWGSLAGAVLATLLLSYGRRGGEALLLRLIERRVPESRLRRSALAAGVLLLATLVPGLAVQAVHTGLKASGMLGDTGDGLLRAVAMSAYFGAFVSGLGSALLAARHASWRLLPLDSAAVRRLRPATRLVALTAGLGVLMEQLSTLAGLSLASSVFSSAALAALNGVAVLALLRRLRGLHSGADEAAPPPWLRLLAGAAGVAVLAVFVALATGFIALAGFIARQTVWVGIVVATLYLLLLLIDDFFTTLLSSQAERKTGADEAAPAGNRSLADQAGALLSGLVRLAALALALSAVLAPYGADPGTMFGKVVALGTSLSIGEVRLSPWLVLKSIALLVAGFALLREVQRWFTTQYLPRTQLDPGLGSSLNTLIGYSGGVVVIAFALSTLGLSVERIAWVASALSVGIGFGLQAIVQNFVSGLILLAERPVKVGDWVSLGDAEGDIKRINVRATEIQLADKSTVIVPNSELITKTVRNVTWGSPEGRVLIKLPMPLDTDPEALRRIVLEVFAAHPAVLPRPEPGVALEGIDTGALMFACTAFVGSPRQTYGVRSQLLFTLLARLRAEGLELGKPPTTLLLRGEAPSSAGAARPLD